MDRRGFLQSILVAGVSPAIVRASSLMACSGFVIPTRQIILPEALIVPKHGRVLTVSANSHGFLTSKAEGLIEIRRYTTESYRDSAMFREMGRFPEERMSVEMVEFALPDPHMYRIQ